MPQLRVPLARTGPDGWWTGPDGTGRDVLCVDLCGYDSIYVRSRASSKNMKGLRSQVAPIVQARVLAISGSLQGFGFSIHRRAGPGFVQQARHVMPEQKQSLLHSTTWGCFLVCHSAKWRQLSIALDLSWRRFFRGWGKATVCRLWCPGVALQVHFGSPVGLEGGRRHFRGTPFLRIPSVLLLVVLTQR